MRIAAGSPQSSSPYRGANSRVRWAMLSQSLTGVSFAPLSDRFLAAVQVVCEDTRANEEATPR